MQMNHGHITGLHLLLALLAQEDTGFVRFSEMLGTSPMIFWKKRNKRSLVSRVSPEENFPSQEKCNRCSMRQKKAENILATSFFRWSIFSGLLEAKNTASSLLSGLNKKDIQEKIESLRGGEKSLIKILRGNEML